MEYLSSEYHKICIIAYQKKIEVIKQSDKTQLENYVSKANSDLADKIYLYNCSSREIILFEYYLNILSLLEQL